MDSKLVHLIGVYLYYRSPGGPVMGLYRMVAAREKEAHDKLAVLDEVDVDGERTVETS